MEVFSYRYPGGVVFLVPCPDAPFTIYFKFDGAGTLSASMSIPPRDEEEIASLQKQLVPKSSPRREQPSSRLWIGGAMVVGTVGLTLGLAAPFVFARTPLPYMATPSRKVRRALQTISNGSGTFVDLGSGDGEAIYEASKLGYAAIGYELNYTLYALSQFRRRFWGKELRSRSQFLCKDFFQTSLPPKTSVVMIFGVTPLMRPLSERLALALPQNAHVLSYRFKLPINKPGLLHAEIVYDHEEMRIYEVRSPKSQQVHPGEN